MYQIYKCSNIKETTETPSIVKRRDTDKYGDYRTKYAILEIYDEMVECERTGREYKTRLDPPPADPRVAHKEC